MFFIYYNVVVLALACDVSLPLQDSVHISWQALQHGADLLEACQNRQTPSGESDTYQFSDVNPCSSQKTGEVHPMLLQCWPNVADGGPTLQQH